MSTGSKGRHRRRRRRMSSSARSDRVHLPTGSARLRTKENRLMAGCRLLGTNAEQQPQFGRTNLAAFATISAAAVRRRELADVRVNTTITEAAAAPGLLLDLLTLVPFPDISFLLTLLVMADSLVNMILLDVTLMSVSGVGCPRLPV